MTASKRSSATPNLPPVRSPVGIRSATISTVSGCTGTSSALTAARTWSMRSASTPNTARRITSSVIARVRSCTRIGEPTGHPAMSRRVASTITCWYSRMRSP